MQTVGIKEFKTNPAVLSQAVDSGQEAINLLGQVKQLGFRLSVRLEQDFLIRLV